MPRSNKKGALSSANGKPKATRGKGKGKKGAIEKASTNKRANNQKKGRSKSKKNKLSSVRSKVDVKLGFVVPGGSIIDYTTGAINTLYPTADARTTLAKELVKSLDSNYIAILSGSEEDKAVKPVTSGLARHRVTSGYVAARANANLFPAVKAAHARVGLSPKLSDDADPHVLVAREDGLYLVPVRRAGLATGTAMAHHSPATPMIGKLSSGCELVNSIMQKSSSPIVALYHGVRASVMGDFSSSSLNGTNTKKIKNTNNEGQEGDEDGGLAEVTNSDKDDMFTRQVDSVQYVVRVSSLDVEAIVMDALLNGRRTRDERLDSLIEPARKEFQTMVSSGRRVQDIVREESKEQLNMWCKSQMFLTNLTASGQAQCAVKPKQASLVSTARKGANSLAMVQGAFGAAHPGHSVLANAAISARFQSCFDLTGEEVALDVLDDDAHSHIQRAFKRSTLFRGYKNFEPTGDPYNDVKTALSPFIKRELEGAKLFKTTAMWYNNNHAAAVSGIQNQLTTSVLAAQGLYELAIIFRNNDNLGQALFDATIHVDVVKDKWSDIADKLIQQYESTGLVEYALTKEQFDKIFKKTVPKRYNKTRAETQLYEAVKQAYLDRVGQPQGLTRRFPDKVTRELPLPKLQKEISNTRKEMTPEQRKLFDRLSENLNSGKTLSEKEWLGIGISSGMVAKRSECLEVGCMNVNAAVNTAEFDKLADENVLLTTEIGKLQRGILYSGGQNSETLAGVRRKLASLQARQTIVTTRINEFLLSVGGENAEVGQNNELVQLLHGLHRT